jgi:hypothetical protein
VIRLADIEAAGRAHGGLGDGHRWCPGPRSSAVPRRQASLTEGLELATLNNGHYPMFPELARPF